LRRLVALASSERLCEKRSDERVELVRRAVIRVERNQHAILAPDLVSEGREGPRPALAVADGGAGHIRGAAGGHLYDAVGFGLGKAA
jgi:hypothetical protein